jgi:hypothetical protein
MQSLLLTPQEPRWDGLGIGSRLSTMRNKMRERLTYERERAPHEHLSMSLAHVRREHYAPHVVQAIDKSPGG